MKGNVFASMEMGLVVPISGLVRREVGAPFGAGFCGSFGGVSIGREVAGDVVDGCSGFVTEGDGEGVIAEGVRGVIELVREGAVEGEGERLPLDVTGEGDGGITIGLTGMLERLEFFSGELWNGGFLRRFGFESGDFFGGISIGWNETQA